LATVETYARPTWLYRYRSLRRPGAEGDEPVDRTRLDRELDAVEQGYIYCATFNDLNDPMEGFYRSNDRVRKSPDYERFVDKVFDEKLGLGIASFSETWNNELMWAHYADGFRGICIAYPVSRLLAGLDDQHALSRVAYGDKPHYLNLQRMHDEAERARAILSTKNLKWAYEREWRLFAPQPGRATHGVNAAATVFIGIRMPEEDRRLVRRRLRGTGTRTCRTVADGYAVRRWRGQNE
jgi:hypothetical protein